MGQQRRRQLPYHDSDIRRYIGPPSCVLTSLGSWCTQSSNVSGLVHQEIHIKLVENLRISLRAFVHTERNLLFLTVDVHNDSQNGFVLATYQKSDQRPDVL